MTAGFARARSSPPAVARVIRPALRLALVLALLAAACTRPDPPLRRPAARSAELSMLAVGDTGKRPLFWGIFDGQRAVARALAAEDEARPADLLLFLGDNFYPRGLEPHELVERIRVNLVAPYCRFIALAGPRSREVEDACPLPSERRHPVPILAVLGNHDHKAAESPRLEAEAIPRFVSNWRLARGLAEAIELGRGVSLILYDSTAIREGADPKPLRRALAQARGPWRILVSHHPFEDPGTRKALRRELAAAGVPVQLHLAGHEHNLEIVRPSPPGPALEVIAGGGAGARGVKYHVPGRVFVAVAAGFARIELRGRGEHARLFITLVRSPRWPFSWWWERPRAVARWSVDLQGHVRDEEAAAAPAASAASAQQARSRGERPASSGCSRRTASMPRSQASRSIGAS